jgi:exodeoxyribonuclease VII large subunit
MVKRPEVQLQLVTAREVLSVAGLDRVVKQLLEGATEAVRVRGEVSGLHRAASGHLYFTLKDEREDALIECVMYKSAPSRSRDRVGEGERVVVAGRVTVFAPRGRMQLVVDGVLDSGRGELFEALEKLKAKLAAEGLFDSNRKKPLPREPGTLAVLTSRDGAAIHDICRVAFARGPVRILLVPTPVQGIGAAERIVRAIQGVERLGQVDAIIVTRGGGSLEDLAAYNDERLVRAIAAAHMPIVTAVGHETDVCLADLAADARAATPSQAAELLVPDQRERLASLEHLRMRTLRAVRYRLAVARERLTRLEAGLGQPHRQLLEGSQRIDDLTTRIERTMHNALRARRDVLHAGLRRLEDQHPRRVLAAARMRLQPFIPRMEATMARRLAARRSELASLAARLDALSPLAVLARGYAIATVAGRVLRDASEVRPGDRVAVRLASGSIAARVEPTDGH